MKKFIPRTGTGAAWIETGTTKIIIQCYGHWRWSILSDIEKYCERGGLRMVVDPIATPNDSYTQATIYARVEDATQVKNDIEAILSKAANPEGPWFGGPLPEQITSIRSDNAGEANQ